MRVLAERYPSARYVIVGDGPCRAELEALAGSLGIISQVQFWGHVDDETKSLLYRASDVFAMASRHGPRGEIEGFGIVFLEANDHGLAVVGSDAGGIPDAIETGVNGLLVQPDDPNAMAAAISELLEDDDTREAMAASGQLRIRSHLNWASISAHIEAELVTVVSSSR